MDRERVVIAEILRPRGNRGELVVRSQTDVPGRLENLERAQIRLADGSDVTMEIEEAWEHKGDWVLKLAGVDSIDEADRFRNSDVWVSLAERAHLPEDEYFQSDLLGCAIVDAASGDTLGTVENFYQFGGPPLIEMTRNGREVLIPFVKPIYESVDVMGRTIRVNLPEGLLDLESGGGS